MDGGPKSRSAPNASEILVAGLEGYARVYDAPPGPLDGDRERLRVWAEVISGLEMDINGGTNVLNSQTWQQRRQLLRKLGGRPLPAAHESK